MLSRNGAMVMPMDGVIIKGALNTTTISHLFTKEISTIFFLNQKN